MTTNIIAAEIKDVSLVWPRLRACLEDKKGQLAEAILYYPPPIPACDAQFNFLLAERARVAQSLVKLDKLAQTGLPNKDELLALVA